MSGDLRIVRHVGLPVACAGCIQIGNIIHIDSEAFVVTKVGGAAFDMVLAPVLSSPDNTYKEWRPQ